MIDHDEVARWLRSYVEAWRSYDPDAIGSLFSEDCTYRYRPDEGPLRGREAIVESWLTDDPDEPGTYDAAYEPVAIDGEVAVAVGSSTYTDGADGPVRAVYDNCFLLRFDDRGRCREFTEWFMQRPDGSGG